MADAQTGAYKPISQFQTPEDFSNLLSQQKQARQRREIEWKLNLAYYRGDQWVYWNPGLKQIERVPTEDGEKARHRVRFTVNQVTPGTQSLISKLIKTKPIFQAEPGQVGDKAVKASEFSEMLLEGWWRQFELGAGYEEALLWSIHCGDGYIFVDWDPFANKSMRILLDPQGQPITDDAHANEYRALLEQEGIPPQEQVVYMGDLRVRVMSPFHVFGDPTAQDAASWKWCITQHNLDPDDVYSRYGVQVAPDAVAGEPEAPLPIATKDSGTNKNVVKVYCFYHRPTPALPNGRYYCWTESGGKQKLYDGPWPEELPADKLPIIQFKGIKVPGQAAGDALTSHVRPINKQLNRMASQITEFFNLTLRPQWMAPVNSFPEQQKLTNEPGAVWTYNPVPAGGSIAKPEPVDIPMIPAYVFEFMDRLVARCREAYGLTEVTEGTLPPNLEAADAIDLLQEMATDRFAPSIEDNERALGRLGQIMLNIAQQKYEEPRLLIMGGTASATGAKEFTKADFAGDITVKVLAGSSMPRTRAAQRKQIEKWMELGIVDPRKAWRYYDQADLKDIAFEFAQDEDQALRENDKIVKGVPLNPEALQQAIGAVQQGINPETGQPLTPQDDPRELLLRASLKPQLVENLQTHMDTHGKVIKALEFDSYQPDVRHRFLTHWDLTRTLYLSLPQMPEKVDAPKVSLQLKGDVGATTVADILRRGGVPDADAQTIATEPPLETLVVDSIDKPDTDAGSPGAEANHLSKAAATVLQAQVANATAQLQNAQSQELHQHAVRKANADATFAEKKAKQGPPKAAPKAPQKSNGK